MIYKRIKNVLDEFEMSVLDTELKKKKKLDKKRNEARKILKEVNEPELVYNEKATLKTAKILINQTVKNNITLF